MPQFSEYPLSPQKGKDPKLAMIPSQSISPSCHNQNVQRASTKIKPSDHRESSSRDCATKTPKGGQGVSALCAMQTKREVPPKRKHPLTWKNMLLHSTLASADTIHIIEPNSWDKPTSPTLHKTTNNSDATQAKEKEGEHTTSPPFPQVRYPHHPKYTSLHLNRLDLYYIFQHPPPIFYHVWSMCRGGTSHKESPLTLLIPPITQKYFILWIKKYNKKIIQIIKLKPIYERIHYHFQKFT